MGKNEVFNTEERLTHALRKLQALFDGINEPVYVSDPDTYEILFANKKLKELAGERILGSKCYKAFQNLSKPCSFCTNKYVFGENLGKTYTWQYQNPGNKRWYKCVDKAIEWPGGKRVRFEMAIDITEHKQKEERLQETNGRLQALVEAVSDVVFFKDVKGRNLVVNRAFEKLVGLTQEEIVGKTDEQLFPKDFAEKCRNSDEEVLRKGKILRFKEQIIGNKGEKRLFDTVKAPIHDNQGNIVGLVGVDRDVTKYKRAEEALRESEALFRSFVESSHGGILIIDDNFRIVYANDETTRITGYPMKELVGQDFRKYLDEESKSLVERRYLRRQKGEKVPPVYEFKIIGKDGEKRDVEIRPAVMWNGQGKAQTVAQILDITKRKGVEEALKESEEKFRTLAEQSPSMIFINKRGRVVYANKKSEEIMGYKREEFYSPDFEFLTLIAPESRDLIKENFSRHMKGEEVVPYEYTLVTREGRRIEALLASRLIRYGAESAILGTVTDITELKKAEERIRESEEKYRNLFENASDPIITLGCKGNVMSINKIAKEYGYERGELVGKSMLHFVPKKYWRKLGKHTKDILRGKNVQGEVEIITKKGNIFAEYRGNPIEKNGRVVGAQIILRDATERKEVEERLKESEEKYRTLVENASDLIMITQPNGIISYLSPNCNDILGHGPEDLVGRTPWIILKDDSKKVHKVFHKALKGTPVKNLEYRIVTKKGKIRWVSHSCSPVIVKKKILFLESTVKDITKRKKMEKERKRFQERLSALNKYGRSLNMAESLGDVYNVTLKAMEKTLGFEYASILKIQGKRLQLVSQRGYSNNLSLDLSLDGEKGVTVKAAKTGKPILVPDVRNEKAYILGKPNMISELAVPIKMEKAVLGVLNVESNKLAAFGEEDRELLEILASHTAIAISDIKKHTQLKKLSNRLANLLESSTEIMRIKDTHQRLKVVTRAIRRFGWRRVVISLRDENLEGTAIVTAGLTKEEIKLLLERKASGHVWRERLGPKFERFKLGEFYYLPWSDPWIREYVHHVPPEAPSDEATTYAGVPSKRLPEEMIDWHPQDMLYAPLRTPEGRIVGILSMDDPVDGRTPARESIAPLGLFLHQAAIVIENAQLIDRLRKARLQLEAYTEQLEQKVEERTRELKESQEQLLKAQRLAVIGELAGMVGHDLRNPLTSINGAAYYLKKRLSREIDGEVKEMFDLMERNIVYSNKIINDLLDYSREIRLDLTESNPKSIIREALSLVEIPKNVQVINLTENKPKIKVDVGKIKRAFVNIIRNAIEAMPKGGTLTIESKKSNGYLNFVFSDTGVGMSKKTMKKLWTLLFTTKAKGMGFGLPICKRVIEAHEGSISLESAWGKGTVFTVTIPTELKIEGGEKVWIKALEFSLSTTMRT